jgi:tyrosyl-tRNA synthetase
MFTDLEVKKIEELSNNDINSLKILLANEATKMLHGKEAALKAEKTAKNIFEKGSIGDDLKTVLIKKQIIDQGVNIIDLVLQSELFISKSEIRRTIKNKGIKLNNNAVEDEKKIISFSNFEGKDYLKLSHGKKKHVIIKIIN